MERMHLRLSRVTQRSCQSPSVAAVAQAGRMSTNVSWPAAVLYECVLCGYAMGMCYGLAVNTKAEVRFHVKSADWIPERVKNRVHSMV